MDLEKKLDWALGSLSKYGPQEWKPTHRITYRYPGSPTFEPQVFTYDVMLVGAKAFQKREWEQGKEPEWTYVRGTWFYDNVPQSAPETTVKTAKGYRAGGKRRQAVMTKYGPRGGRTEIQSLLFPVKLWTEARAKAWCKKNDFRMGDVDVTDNYIRLRQFEPERFARHRIICLYKRKGVCRIKAVVGVR
jgi:hypothetical protein